MTKTSLTKLNSFKWTPVRLKAAKLAADTTMTQEEIAEQCKVSRQTVNEWFQAQDETPPLCETHPKQKGGIMPPSKLTVLGLESRAVSLLEEGNTYREIAALLSTEAKQKISSASVFRFFESRKNDKVEAVQKPDKTRHF